MLTGTACGYSRQAFHLKAPGEQRIVSRKLERPIAMSSSTSVDSLHPSVQFPSMVDRSNTETSAGGPSTSLLRALAILELIAQKSGGLTNAEISRRLQIATSSTTYIVSRLERKGYLKREPEHGRYEIGLKVVALAHGALREMGLRRAAEPVLHRLVAETHYSGIVAVLDRALVMIVDKVGQPALFKLDMDIGVRYPAHTTALGKVLLAHLPVNEVIEIFDRFGSMRKPCRREAPPKSGFMRELEDVKRNGYAISDGELFPGLWAAAAPIFDRSGTVLASVSATGGPLRVDESAIVSSVKLAAHEISLRLTART
jgi:IclR family transcriptional regulator, KDG regulon repressor